MLDDALQGSAAYEQALATSEVLECDATDAEALLVPGAQAAVVPNGNPAIGPHPGAHPERVIVPDNAYVQPGQERISEFLRATADALAGALNSPNINALTVAPVVEWIRCFLETTYGSFEAGVSELLQWTSGSGIDASQLRRQLVGVLLGGDRLAAEARGALLSAFQSSDARTDEEMQAFLSASQVLAVTGPAAPPNAGSWHGWRGRPTEYGTWLHRLLQADYARTHSGSFVITDQWLVTPLGGERTLYGAQGWLASGMRVALASAALSGVTTSSSAGASPSSTGAGTKGGKRPDICDLGPAGQTGPALLYEITTFEEAAKPAKRAQMQGYVNALTGVGIPVELGQRQHGWTPPPLVVDSDGVFATVYPPVDGWVLYRRWGLRAKQPGWVQLPGRQEAGGSSRNRDLTPVVLALGAVALVAVILLAGPAVLAAAGVAAAEGSIGALGAGLLAAGAVSL